MNKIINICKWLACSYVENFCVGEDSFIICGYDMFSCVAVIATYNEHGVPICHLIRFNDDWDDESIENCESVFMEELPFPYVPCIDNAYKLFSISIEDAKTALWLGGNNYGCNVFNIVGDNHVEVVAS